MAPLYILPASFFPLLVIIAATGTGYTGQAQRVAPGVPPQQYQQHQQQVPVHQQQVPVHQQQQVPMHQQQVPVQQQVPQYQQQQQIPVQQVPVQQVPVQQVPVQQVPVQQQQMHGQVPVQQQQQMHMQQGHHQQGHHPHGQQLLNAANIAQERDHIQEHLEVPVDTSKMSEQELQFHYFKMHDADNNNKLDGSELIKSLIHWHEQGHKDPNSNIPTGQKVFNDDELAQMIDPILKADDGNSDGYIDYPEFVRAQQKAAAGAGAGTGGH